jgi:hypothetical protein
MICLFRIGFHSRATCESDEMILIFSTRGKLLSKLFLLRSNAGIFKSGISKVGKLKFFPPHPLKVKIKTPDNIVAIDFFIDFLLVKFVF